MESSLFKDISAKNIVYKGEIGSIRECVTGRLFFVIDQKENAKNPKPYEKRGAKIAVGSTSDIEFFLTTNENSNEIVAAVQIGRSSELYDTNAFNIPILTLSHLPEDHDGKIAILDASRKLLFVDPDIDVVEVYTRELEKKRSNELKPCVPTSHYTAFSNDGKKKTVGVLHICSAGTSGELRSEDELFDDYRELCEGIRPIPLTLMLCPAFPLQNVSSERFTAHVRAIFRAAVYGKIRILCGGPCTLSSQGIFEYFEQINKIKSFAEEKHEINQNIPCGLLISTPLTLFSVYPTHTKNSIRKTDLICFDLKKLSHLLLGDIWIDSSRADALNDLYRLFKETITQAKLITDTVCAIADKEIASFIYNDQELTRAIDMIFIKNEK